MAKHMRRPFPWVRVAIGTVAAGVLVCAGAYFGGDAWFNRTHFNPNVTVDGVSVGRLSVTKATAKVNAAGFNTAFLRDGKVHIVKFGHDQTVSKAEMQKYFNRQRTLFASNRSWSFAPEDLKESTQKLSELKNARVTLTVRDHQYTLAPNDAFVDIRYYDGHYHYDYENVNNKLASIISQNNTLGQSYDITTPDGQKITVKNDTYGWRLNTDQLVHALQDEFSRGGGEIDGVNYLQGRGYNENGLGYGETANHGLGNNYVLVSLKQQKLWVIKDGKPVVTVNDVVTGTADTSKGRDNRTPTGVYYIMYKQPNATLRGKNDDGSNYASPVKYWMPFTQGGCGLHDASWRKDWSKQAYLEGGSHGCVNIKPSDIESVWQATFQNEPVVVYDN